MPNRHYRSGVRLEREIRQILEERYKIPCLRTAGSKSDFDLIALGRRTILIQVKYTEKENLIKPSLELIRKSCKYISYERWVAIIMVQKQTRMTTLTWMHDISYADAITVKFSEAMDKLNQLCSGYEIDNP
jgi:Holliday junction resolvase